MTERVSFQIEPLAAGGFIVAKNCNYGPSHAFACTTLGEALDYVRAQLSPPVDMRPGPIYVEPKPADCTAAFNHGFDAGLEHATMVLDSYPGALGDDRLGLGNAILAHRKKINAT